jgi:hypothetical protein
VPSETAGCVVDADVKLELVDLALCVFDHVRE